MVRREALLFEAHVSAVARQQVQQRISRRPRPHRAVRAVEKVEAAELVEADQKIETARRGLREHLRERALPAVIGIADDREDAHGQILGDAAHISRREDRDSVPALLDPVRDVHAIPLQPAAGK